MDGCSSGSFYSNRSSFSEEDEKFQKIVLSDLIDASEPDDLVFFVDRDLDVASELDKGLASSRARIKLILFAPSPKLEELVNQKFRDNKKIQIILLPFDMPSVSEDLDGIVLKIQEKVSEGVVFKTIVSKGSVSGVALYDRFLKSPEYRSFLLKWLVTFEEDADYTIPVLKVIKEKDPERKEKMLRMLKEIDRVDTESSEEKFLVEVAQYYDNATQFAIETMKDAAQISKEVNEVRTELSERELMEELERRFKEASEF